MAVCPREAGTPHRMCVRLSHGSAPPLGLQTPLSHSHSLPKCNHQQLSLLLLKYMQELGTWERSRVKLPGPKYCLSFVHSIPISPQL